MLEKAIVIEKTHDDKRPWDMRFIPERTWIEDPIGWGKDPTIHTLLGDVHDDKQMLSMLTLESQKPQWLVQGTAALA